MKKFFLPFSIVFLLFLVSCVDPNSTRIKVLLPNDIYAGKPFTMRVGVVGPLGLLLSNVDIEIDGRTYRTDSSGYAQVQLLFMGAGSYRMKVRYETIVQEVALNVKPASWLILGWIGADNNLSVHVNSDIEEMKRAAKDVAVILLVDRPGSFDGIYALSSDGEFLQIKTLGEINSGSESRLRWFVNEYRNYDATRKALIMWNHGAAWNDTDPYSVKSISYDDTDRDFLTMNELKEALKNTHWDVLGFDACLMASAEVLYELKDVADFFLAAPGEIPSDGWDYSFLKEISNSDPKEFCLKVVEFWRTYYGGRYTVLFDLVLNAWETEKLAEAVDLLAQRLKSYPPTALPNCSAHSLYSLNPRLCDFGEILASFGWTDVLERFQQARLPRAETAKLYLSVFLPQSALQLNSYRDMYSKLSFAAQTGWLDWLEERLNSP